MRVICVFQKVILGFLKSCYLLRKFLIAGRLKDVRAFQIAYEEAVQGEFIFGI